MSTTAPIISKSKSLPRSRNRRGASAVEFALVAPIFFLVVFACFEFGRASMIETFTEEAAFAAARHIVVPGATVQEGITLANDELTALGIDNPTISVAPTSNGSAQTEIDHSTDWVEVTVSVPMADNITFGLFFNNAVITRTAKVKTERY